MNCAHGQSHGQKIQRPNMKSVYVNGTLNTPNRISEIASEIRNLRRFGAERWPNVSTRITIRLPIKAAIPVLENRITIHVRLVRSSVSSELRLGLRYIRWDWFIDWNWVVLVFFSSPVMFIVFNHTGSIFRGGENRKGAKASALFSQEPQNIL